MIAPGGLNVSNIVTVAASTQNDSMASFSNHGEIPVRPEGTGSRHFQHRHRRGGKLRVVWAARSMAAPHVAGVLALVLAIHPTMTVSQVIDRLLLNVDPVVADPVNDAMTSTAGRLNAYRAVKIHRNPAYNSDWDGDGRPKPFGQLSLR